jgi:hypothetical protein
MISILKLIVVLTFLLAKISFANTAHDTKTLLTIKLYSEPKDRDKRLSYHISLPKDEYYSYYLGSDLPTWHFVNSTVIKGEFHSVELVNIRIHPNQYGLGKKKVIACKKAHLTINDPENARVIWQGKLNYGCANHKITAVTKIDNQKYYDTKVKIDNHENTVWVETGVKSHLTA